MNAAVKLRHFSENLCKMTELNPDYSEIGESYCISKNDCYASVKPPPQLQANIKRPSSKMGAIVLFVSAIALLLLLCL